VTLELLALWWCYGFGALVAVGVYCVTILWLMDKLSEVFRVKRAIIDWAWHRAKGYELHEPKRPTQETPR
jgi:hypothetical protein